MASGRVGTQFCSLWRKIGILKKTDKNLCCNIFRKRASTGVREVKDKRKSALGYLMVHSDDTAEKHYYIRKKELSTAAGSSSLREAVFKLTGLTSSQVSTKGSTAMVSIQIAFIIPEKSMECRRSE